MCVGVWLGPKVLPTSSVIVAAFQASVLCRSHLVDAQPAGWYRAGCPRPRCSFKNSSKAMAQKTTQLLEEKRASEVSCYSATPRPHE